MQDYDPFVDFIMQEAEKSGKLFLVDSGEGRGYVDATTGWYVEDIFGWLIYPNDHERFIESRKHDTVYEDFNEEYVLARWSKDDDGTLSIDFIKY